MLVSPSCPVYRQHLAMRPNPMVLLALEVSAGTHHGLVFESSFEVTRTAAEDTLVDLSLSLAADNRGVGEVAVLEQPGATAAVSVYPWGGGQSVVASVMEERLCLT